MIVAITDGRANISLKRSTDPEAAAAADVPKPSSQELKVTVSPYGKRAYHLRLYQIIDYHYNLAHFCGISVLSLTLVELYKSISHTYYKPFSIQSNY